MRQFCIWTTVIVSLALPLVLHCTDEANPYLSESNAGILVRHATFSDRDTVDIFSPETVVVAIVLRDFVESVTVHIDHNRLWAKPDTTLHNASFDGRDMAFALSFYDTGWQTAAWCAYLSSGDSVCHTYELYARSPLVQSTVRAKPGDTLTLSTPPVKDAALYIWDFKDGIVVRDQNPSSPFVVRVPLTRGFGELYVADRTYRSPSFTFQIVPSGNSALRIEVVADSMQGDTILAPDPAEYSFQVRVSGLDIVESSFSIDNKSFDRVYPLNDTVYMFVGALENIGTEATGVVVAGKDGAGNNYTRRFFIRYDPTLRMSYGPRVTILYPDNDSTTVSGNQIVIRGNVVRLDRDSLALFIQVNDSLYSEWQSVKNDSVWIRTAQLAQGTNRIIALLYDDRFRQGDPVSADTIFVTRTSGAVDSIPPKINAFYVNSDPLGDSLFVEDTAVTIGVMAYDISGIASVAVNGSVAIRATASDIFTAHIRLYHMKSGNLITVTVRDSAQNTTTARKTIFQNSLPVFTALPSWSGLVVDSMRYGHIAAFDKDGDTVSLALRISRARGDTSLLPDAQGIVGWRPMTSDTGWHTLIARAWDGFQIRDTLLKAFVALPGNRAVPVRFKTSDADFPDTLRAETDSLRVNLETSPATGTPPFTFGGRFVYDTTRTVPVTSGGVVLWRPMEIDTGKQRVRFTVRDSLGYRDSIDVIITVLPLQTVSVSFESSGSSGFESVSPISIRVVLSEVSSKTIVIPYEIERNLSTADSTDAELGDMRTIQFDPGEQSKAISLGIVNDSLVERDEKLVVVLRKPIGNATLGRTTSHTYTIRNDDKVSVRFEENGSSSSESVAAVPVWVVLARAVPESVSVDWEVSATSTADTADYRLNTPKKIWFTPGETRKSIGIAIVNDTRVEPDETIVLQLTSGGLYGSLVSPSTYTTGIINDDSPQIKAFFGTSSVQVPESVGQVIVKVKLSAAAQQSLQVSYYADTAASTAKGSDYSLSPGTLTFAAGETEKQFTVSIIDDAALEKAETLYVRLRNPSAPLLIGSPARTAIVIADNDEPPTVGVTFALSSSQGIESQSASIDVVLTAKTSTSVTVSYVVDAAASTATTADYSLPSTKTLTFAPGDTLEHIPLTIINDTQKESSETIVLKLVNPGQYLTIGLRSAHTYTIADDEIAIVVVISPAGSGSVSRKVNGVENPGPYTVGTPVVCTATPANGYQFLYWSGQLSGSSNPVTHTVKSNGTVTANFGLIQAPLIVTEPSPVTVNEQEPAGFSVAATGADLRYRWQRNSSDISGAASSTWQIAEVSLADSGALYRCIITNAGGADTSQSVFLHVIANPPAITGDPLSQAATEGSTVSFSVTATGSRLKFQWQRNATTIQGATGQTYTTPALMLADNGSVYRCIVANSGGADTSSGALLTVQIIIVPPQIQTDPANVTAMEGNSASFSVSSTGTSLGYQWQQNGQNITGATSSTYVISAVALGDNGSTYRCIASNSAGRDTSASATLTVTLRSPQITLGPKDTLVVEGSPVSFSVEAIGSLVSFQWLKNGAPISGAQANTYWIASVNYLADNGATFRCIVKNSAGHDTSSNALLTVQLKPPVITGEPQNLTVQEGTSATLTVAATGTNVSYSWYKKLATDQLVKSSQENFFSLATAAYADSGSLYYVIAINSAGQDTSRVAVVQVNLLAPNITDHSDDTTVTEGEQVSLGVEATGTNKLYQWQVDGSEIAGAESATYVISAASLSLNGKLFRCIVANSGGSDTTQDIAVTVEPVVVPEPEIAVLQNGIAIASGGSFDFGDVTEGSGKDVAFVISNTGSASLDLTGVTIGGTGAGMFSVILLPVSPVVSGGSTSFTVRYAPSGTGASTATVSIGSNDADENPYAFQITGNGTALPEPIITVLQGDNAIAPEANFVFESTTIGTARDVTFTIKNDGSASLTVDGISISGTDSDRFSLVVDAVSPVASGQFTTFTIRFAPTGTVTRTVTVSIANNDSDQNPYVFTIQGTGVAVPPAPEIEVNQNGIIIESGGTFNFGLVTEGTTLDTTFTISNTGTATLNLTGSALVKIVGKDSALFTVLADPAPTISAGVSTTFTIRASPGANLGAIQTVVSITSNDANENPYTFAIGADVQ